MAKELPPIEPELNRVWLDSVINLFENPGAVQPVRLRNPATGEFLMSFRISFVEDGGKTYFQLEDFDPCERCEEFLHLSTLDWQLNIGGIYRLPVNLPEVEGYFLKK